VDGVAASRHARTGADGQPQAGARLEVFRCQSATASNLQADSPLPIHCSRVAGPQHGENSMICSASIVVLREGTR
jgi:hypothetical protein